MARRGSWAEVTAGAKGCCVLNSFCCVIMSFRPSRGTDREGAKGTSGVFPEMEDLTYSPKM